MRLVVGPLPASVYWKRRAMVLGGTVLAVLIVFYSCNASGKTNPGAQSTPTPTASPSASPSAAAVVAPVTEVSPTPTSTVPVVNPQACTDAELSVTAVPAKTALAKGTELQITLLIKNISNRACNRDIGADQQELRIVLGTEKIWSSDDCDGPTGAEDRNFPAGHERSYQVIWNGKSSSSCSKTAKRTPDGPVPAAGDYQLFGRVGTDLSDAVVIKLS
ncbi:MAG TPA: hypothetical protein DGG94_09615 [Micromonosporaceae bacterium]|nr:hypothetical protein [Micromonosporaceae bacterium]